MYLITGASAFLLLETFVLQTRDQSGFIVCNFQVLVVFLRDAKIEDLRVTRNNLCDILGIPRPVLKVMCFNS